MSRYLSRTGEIVIFEAAPSLRDSLIVVDVHWFCSQFVGLIVSPDHVRPSPLRTQPNGPHLDLLQSFGRDGQLMITRGRSQVSVGQDVVLGIFVALGLCVESPPGCFVIPMLLTDPVPEPIFRNDRDCWFVGRRFAFHSCEY